MPRSSLEYSVRWRVLYRSVVEPWNPLTIDALALTVLWVAKGVLMVAAPKPTARQVIWARQVVATIAARERAERVRLIAAGWILYQPASKTDS